MSRAAFKDRVRYRSGTTMVRQGRMSLMLSQMPGNRDLEVVLRSLPDPEESGIDGWPAWSCSRRTYP